VSTLKPPVGAADHAQGPESAPVTLVEYGDYECPYCGAAYPVVKRLQKHYGNRLRFVFRNFPLTNAHPHAELAAETAEFAGAHEKFWEMHDLLYENQDRLGISLFEQLADSLQLPLDELAQALQSHQFKSRVRADFSSGARSGVNGTPTFFINGTRYENSPEYPDMLAAIDEALKGHSKSANA
jgi:protein-disulfide isomerase